MPKPVIHVDGLREVKQALRRAGSTELDDELKSIHKELAAEITRRALPKVPVRTGALKASVRSSGTKASAIGRAGKAAVPYAPVIHWGGRGIKGRPFLKDAADAVERDVVDRYVAAMNDLYRRLGLQ